MYLIPILALAVVLVIGTAWSPLFALIVAVPLFVLFLAYVGFSWRADEKATGTSGAPVSGESEHRGGVWGEKSA
jgi:hypothetical protein